MIKKYEIISKYTCKLYGDMHYIANFITDNETFVKCKLNIYGVRGNEFQTISKVKVREGDKFDLFIGQSLALNNCIELYVRREMKDYKNMQDILYKHIGLVQAGLDYKLKKATTKHKIKKIKSVENEIDPNIFRTPRRQK